MSKSNNKYNNTYPPRSVENDKNIYYAKHAMTIWLRCKEVSLKYRYFVAEFLNLPILHSSRNIAIFNHAVSCIIYYRPRNKYYFANIPGIGPLNAEIWCRIQGTTLYRVFTNAYPAILRIVSFYKLIFNVASRTDY